MFPREKHQSLAAELVSMLYSSVKHALVNAEKFAWSLQGFGMLRLYLTPETRLHVWHSAFSVPNYSPIHDHPWDFTSLILAGEIRQHRYLKLAQKMPSHCEEYLYTKIRCGAGGGPVEDRADPIYLRRLPLETYKSGELYDQKANELHESMPIDGTVTIINRQFKSDPEHAIVAWKSGPWVSAEPRLATPYEVRKITETALGLMP
jgi:hypothetical protein